MGVASLVLGIISIVLSLFGVGIQWVGAICGIVGIVCGVQARKVPEKQGLGTAGLVCSIIGTVLCLVTYLACVACVGGLAAAGSSM